MVCTRTALTAINGAGTKVLCQIVCYLPVAQDIVGLYNKSDINREFVYFAKHIVSPSSPSIIMLSAL
jgi:hypothetical protein